MAARNPLYNSELYTLISSSLDFDYNLILSSNNINQYFSPIDNFIDRNRKLNILIFNTNEIIQRINEMQKQGIISEAANNLITNYINDPSNVKSEQYNLILLGFISSIESYFRELIRKIIPIDQIAFQNCSEKVINFSSAYYQQKEFLPEAFLEYKTFISKREIIENLKEYISLGDTNLIPDQLNNLLDEYSKICELRHCITHRYSRVGVKNLNRLNMNDKENNVEKLISIDYTSIQKFSQILFELVLVINNFLFTHLLNRTVIEFNGRYPKKEKIMWNMNWADDKEQFNLYYDLFRSKLHISETKITNFRIYQSFIKYIKELS